jgi:APA family basic amino acid/polyamine antiporter
MLWNEISISACAHAIRTNWWYDDLSTLSLPLFERVVASLETRGTRPESIAGALVHYAKKSLPSLHRRHSGRNACTHGPLVPAIVALAEDDQ